MLTYDINEHGSKSIYQWLYENIKNDILKGTLLAEEKLPSKRSLANQLNISVITVENAYSQLIVEGYVYSIEKKGYFVNKLEHIIIKEDVMTKKRAEKEKKTYDIDLTINTSFPETFPFSIWSKLVRNVLTEYQKDILEPGSFQGIRLLREEISNHLYAFHGMTVDPGCIVIGAGTEYLYGLLIQLLGRNKVYAVEDPGYSKIRFVYKYNDVKFNYIPIDNSGLSAPMLSETDTEIIHISPAHHFPTGRVMPIKRRQELLNWANLDNNRYIIEDDYDSEFRFTGRPIPTIKSVDCNEKVIYINTFSKTISPSLRISYLVLPEHLMKQYEETLSFYSCTVPSFTQYTLAEFIKNGYLEQHINRMRTYYRNLRDKLIFALEQSDFADKISIREEDAGLHFLLYIKSSLTPMELAALVENENIKISWLHDYYFDINKNAQLIAVINYSALKEEDIIIFINAISKILNHIQSSK